MELELDSKYPVSCTSTELESVFLTSLAKAGAVGLLAMLPMQNANCASVSDLSTVRAVVRGQNEWRGSASTLTRKDHSIEIQVATSDLLSSAAQLLGENSYERFAKFMSYPDGWGDGFGKKVSPQSVAALQNFLSDGRALPSKTSLFLRRDGNLQLAWEDTEGCTIELDFFPSEIAFYYEKNDQEATFPLTMHGIGSLKENIQTLLLS